MSSYFGNDADTPPTKAIKLPSQRKHTETNPKDIEKAAEAGKALGFINREPDKRRKPGPKPVEPQARFSFTGPQRVIDRLKARCGDIGGSYWQAIEQILDEAEGEG